MPEVKPVGITDFIAVNGVKSKIKRHSLIDFQAGSSITTHSKKKKIVFRFFSFNNIFCSQVLNLASQGHIQIIITTHLSDFT